jgi:MFS family permease
MAISAGIWYSASVFFVALLSEFRQNYASTASIYSLFTVCYGIGGMIAGGLVDRVGARRTILLGGLLVPVALAANSLVPSLGWMYLSQGVLVALGMSASGYVPVSALLTRCFDRHRGLAIGLASAGVGIGIMTVVPLTQWLIEHAGWRFAYLTLAVGNGVVVIPVSLLLLPDERRAAPGSLQREPDGMPAVSRPGPAPASSLLAALATREFWLVTATFSLINSPTQLVLTHHVAHMVEAGQGKMLVAGIVGIVGLMSIPGKILWGYLSDRWWLEMVYAAGVSCLVASIAVLMGMAPGSPAWVLYAYAALMGFGYAVSPAMTPMMSGRFFAGPHFGAILGGLSVFYHTGGAIGVWLAGHTHDLTGSYRLALVAAMLCAMAGVATAWLAAPRQVTAPGMFRRLQR